MAIGSNLSAANRSREHKLLMSVLGLKVHGTKVVTKANLDVVTTTSRQIAVLTKTGADPASSTAADAPTGKGDLCIVLDSTSGAATKLFRCSAYTDATTFTWTQIV